MAKRKSRTQSRASDVSLAPLTPDQALAGLLRVKPADLEKLEQAAKASGAKKPKKAR